MEAAAHDARSYSALKRSDRAASARRSSSAAPLDSAPRAATTLDQLDRFAKIHNVAKHGFEHDRDTHMFSMQDAVLAYVVSRRLGLTLYPLANLVTDWED